ncbi:MAG: O-antigen ligase family protein [Luminiphilus sp.]|nr:O-antigen ligase family protein [Luminiphilus sp.]
MSPAPEIPPSTKRPFLSLRQTQTAWWVVLFFFLCGVLSAAQLVIWLAALASLALILWSRGEWVRLPGMRVYWGMLACLLLPGLISLVDAINPDRALSTIGRLCAYGLAGCLFMRLAPSARQWPTTVLWLSGVLVLWSLDGIVQEWRGLSLSGYRVFTGLPEGHKVTGSMGLDYGPTLAVLSPFLFEALRLHGRKLPWLWLALPLLAVAVALSASRYSALLLLVSAMLCGLVSISHQSLNGYRNALLLALGCLIGLLIPIFVIPHLADRLAIVWHGLSASQEDLNVALAFRPELWKASWLVFTDHWLNGVGIRGSAQAIQPILAMSPGFPDSMLRQPWHPHLGVLEVAADTGLIGVIAYLMLLAMMLRLMFRASAKGICGVPVFAAVAILALFPFSSTLSMYSFSTGSLAWPALAMAAGGYFSSTATT